jgi:hypothetical protein
MENTSELEINSEVFYRNLNNTEAKDRSFRLIANRKIGGPTAFNFYMNVLCPFLTEIIEIAMLMANRVIGGRKRTKVVSAGG